MGVAPRRVLSFPKPHPKEDLMDDATMIARGGQPSWSQEFQHPVHGALTFKVKALPKARDWLDMSVLKEQLAPGVIQGSGLMLAEALAGMMTMMERPVLSEEREEDPDNPGHQKLRQTLYDPTEEEQWEFPVIVWSAFMAWRIKTLSPDVAEQVKNSSGATSGSETDAQSLATTDSPPSTPSSAA